LDQTAVLDIHHVSLSFESQGINTVLADYNVSAQVLGTKGKIGYLIAEIEAGMSDHPLISFSDLANPISLHFSFANSKFSNF
jgi:hypothetical protein